MIVSASLLALVTGLLTKIVWIKLLPYKASFSASCSNKLLFVKFLKHCCPILGTWSTWPRSTWRSTMCVTGSGLSPQTRTAVSMSSGTSIFLRTRVRRRIRRTTLSVSCELWMCWNTHACSLWRDEFWCLKLVLWCFYKRAGTSHVMLR